MATAHQMRDLADRLRAGQIRHIRLATHVAHSIGNAGRDNELSAGLDGFLALLGVPDGADAQHQLGDLGGDGFHGIDGHLRTPGDFHGLQTTGVNRSGHGHGLVDVVDGHHRNHR